MNKSTNPVILITGSARRIGRTIATLFHKNGYRVLVHYRNSSESAQQLVDQLNHKRPNSATCLQANLNSPQACNALIQQAINLYGRLDVVVNNASDYFPTSVGDTTEEQWQQLMNSNLMAPYFLIQAATDELRKNQGNIINIVDIHSEKPLKGYSVYCAAKAGLRMLTQSLAKELAPQVRVNGVAPGATLWPEDKAEVSTSIQHKILTRTPLKKLVNPEDIAATVLFCVHNQSLTGQIINVDCGRSTSM